MTYFFAVVLAFIQGFLTTWITAVFGLLTAVGYGFLAHYLAINYPIIGVGGIIGSVYNCYLVVGYMNKTTPLSRAPVDGFIANNVYIISFLVTFLFRNYI